MGNKFEPFYVYQTIEVPEIKYSEPKTVEQKIAEFIESVKNDDGYKDNNYCIVIWTYCSIGDKRVSAIYKNISQFKKGIFEHIEDIDEMFSIDFEMYIFD